MRRFSSASNDGSSLGERHSAQSADLAECRGPVAVVVSTVLATAFAAVFELTWFRFLLFGPGAAGRFGESWRRTRKNGLRLLVVIVLASVPLLLNVGVAGVVIVELYPESVAQVEAGELEGRLSWADIVITQVLLFLFYGISCGAIAQAFGALTDG